MKLGKLNGLLRGSPRALRGLAMGVMFAFAGIFISKMADEHLEKGSWQDWSVRGLSAATVTPIPLVIAFARKLGFMNPAA